MRAAIALSAPLVEERLLAALLFDENMRDVLDGLDLECLTELHHVAFLEAARNLQTRNAPIGIDEVIGECARIGKEQYVGEYGFALIGELACVDDYGNDQENAWYFAARDLAWLKRLARRRAAL